MPFIKILIVVLITSAFQDRVQRIYETDLCIYGGTSAGVIAAYTAAKMGKSVVLVVPDGHIGGLSSGGLGQTDIGNKHVITGLSRDFYRRVGRVYGKLESWHFEPKVAAQVFQDYLSEVNVTIILQQPLLSVEKQKGRIRSVHLKADQTGKAPVTVKADMFLDCTYEGDLLAAAGVSHIIGREDNTVYGETLNGVHLAGYHQQSGYHQFPDHVDPYTIPGDSASGLLWGISPKPLAPAGSGDGKLQSYNFRICLTDSAENRIPITKPDDYDPDRYELLIRLFEAQPTMRDINQYFIWSRMPNRKTDINNRGAFSTNMIGENYAWPLADPEGRKAIYREHLRYTQGLLYFYQTDPRVPAVLRDFVAEWGYPKDEYVHTDHFTPQLYIREARRMIGEYVMTQHHCQGAETVSDGIGFAAYTMDSHNCQRIVVDGMVKNEGNVEVGGFPPYPISYRAMLPKRAECENLIVPVCLSASHIAFGSIRMEPVFMVLAQSAATAACIAIESGQAVQDVKHESIRSVLEADPYLNGGKRDIYIDNKSLSADELQGDSWERKEGRFYFGSDLAYSANSRASVETTINIRQSGRYAVYYFVPALGDASPAGNYLLQINSSGKIRSAEVDMHTNQNEWTLIGEFLLDQSSPSVVRITRKNKTDPLFFDALLLMPR